MNYSELECQLLLLKRKYRKNPNEDLDTHIKRLETFMNYDNIKYVCPHTICKNYRDQKKNEKKKGGVATLLYYKDNCVLGKERYGNEKNKYNLFAGGVDNMNCYLLEAYRELKEEGKAHLAGIDFKTYLRNIKYYRIHYGSLVLFLEYEINEQNIKKMTQELVDAHNKNYKLAEREMSKVVLFDMNELKKTNLQRFSYFIIDKTGQKKERYYYKTNDNRFYTALAIGIIDRIINEQQSITNKEIEEFTIEFENFNINF
jgi:ribosomal protein L24